LLGYSKGLSSGFHGAFRSYVNLTLGHLRNHLDHKFSLGREIAVQRSQRDASAVSATAFILTRIGILVRVDFNCKGEQS
jgi:hypothetical protein